MRAFVSITAPRLTLTMKAPFFIERQSFAIEQMLRLRVERNVHDDRIGFAQQLIQRHEFHTLLRLRTARVGEHACAESIELLRGTATDAAVSHDAHRERAHAPQPRSRGLPSPCLHFAIEVHEAAREREQHADRMVRNFFEAIVRHVGDPDATARSFIDRDVVEADAESPDDLQRRAGPNGFGGDRRPVRENAGRLMLLDQRLDFGRRRRRGRARNEAEARPLDDLPFDVEIGPGIVGDEDGGAVSGWAHSIRLFGTLMQRWRAS